MTAQGIRTGAPSTERPAYTTELTCYTHVMSWAVERNFYSEQTYFCPCPCVSAVNELHHRLWNMQYNKYSVISRHFTDHIH